MAALRNLRGEKDKCLFDLYNDARASVTEKEMKIKKQKAE